MTEFKHETVLLKEATDNLAIDPTGIYVDATLGRGGHTRRILSQLTSGQLYAFDQDQAAIDAVQAQGVPANLHLLHRNFRELDEALAGEGVTAVNGILYDLACPALSSTIPARLFLPLRRAAGYAHGPKPGAFGAGDRERVVLPRAGTDLHPLR